MWIGRRIRLGDAGMRGGAQEDDSVRGEGFGEALELNEEGGDYSKFHISYLQVIYQE